MRVYGFIYRELMLKKEAIGGFMAQLITPLLYFLFLAFSISKNVSVKYENFPLNYLVYVLPGIVAIQIFYTYPSVSSTTFNDVRFGIIKTTLLSGGTLTGYLMAKIIVESLIAGIISILLLCAGCAFTGIGITILGMIQFFFYFFLSAIFWIATGVITGVKIKGELSRSMIFALLNLPIIFTAPIFYVKGFAPRWIEALAKINPLTYHVDGLRSALLTGFIIPDLWVIAILLDAAVMVFAIRFLLNISPK